MRKLHRSWGAKMGILGVLATEKPKHHEENFGPAGKVCVALIVSNRSGLLDASRYGSFVLISPLVPLFRKGSYRPWAFFLIQHPAFGLRPRMRLKNSLA